MESGIGHDQPPFEPPRDNFCRSEFDEKLMDQGRPREILRFRADRNRVARVAHGFISEMKINEPPRRLPAR